MYLYLKNNKNLYTDSDRKSSSSESYSDSKCENISKMYKRN